MGPGVGGESGVPPPVAPYTVAGQVDGLGQVDVALPPSHPDCPRPLCFPRGGSELSASLQGMASTSMGQGGSMGIAR